MSSTRVVKADGAAKTDQSSQGGGDLAQSSFARPADSRARYLASKLQPDQPVVVIIAGQSSAGKSTILKAAEELGVTPGDRLMPRHTRAGDTAGDKAWERVLCQYPPEARDRNPYAVGPLDRTGRGTVLFAEHKYQGYYGFPSRPLAVALRNGQSVGFIVGRCEEIPAMIEGIRNIAPLTAIAVIRADVPIAVLSQRLSGRPEAFPGELQERVGKLEAMAHADRPQIPGLVQVYGLRSILNLSAEELARQGLSATQVQPASAAQLKDIVEKEFQGARERTIAMASDLLTVRKLDYGHRYIPDALVDVLDNNLALKCEEQGFVPCIKGGLAVGLYLEESRPVSLDIDFTGCEGPDLEERMGRLLEACSDVPAPVKDCWDKKIYHVRGFPGKAKSERFGLDVELDALAITRIQPNNKGFCYVFPFDAVEQFLRRTVVLPSGREVYLCAPEGVIVEKLCAGRSYDVGKFDLYDAAGMMATLPLDPANIRRLLECHYFDAELDKDAVDRLKLSHFRGGEHYAELLGIDSGKMREILGSLIPVSDERLASGPLPVQALTLTSLKRLALVNQLLVSCEKIRSNLHSEVEIGGVKTAIARRFGADKVAQGLNRLERQFHDYAKFELGRLDIYTKRNGTPDTEVNRFFAGLEAQRDRFTPTGPRV